jgi:hypothetical protein
MQLAEKNLERVLLLLGSIFALKLGFTLWISLDEFTYTHAAWMISNGQLPYKDFPLFHPPLLEIVLSPLFFVTDSAFLSVMIARTLLAVNLVTAAILVERLSKAKPGIAFTLTLCVGTFSSWMTEIRPDSLALTLFLFSFYFLEKNRLVLSAIILSLALFTSEKGIIYAPVLAIPLLVSGRFKAAIQLTLITICLTLAFYALLCAVVGFDAAYEFLVGWAIRHETLYPRRSPFNDLIAYSGQLLFLSFFSAIAVFRDYKRNIHWAVLLFLALISYFSQRGPYAYSLLPAVLALIILSSAGISRLVTRAGLVQLILPCQLVTFLVLIFFAPLREQQNTRQLDALKLIDETIPAESCVYDNSGFAVTRNHASYWYFTDELVRNLFMKEFEVEVPQSISLNNCSAMIIDERFSRLSPLLRGELIKLFPNCKGLVCFRGLSKNEAKRHFWAPTRRTASQNKMELQHVKLAQN